jgi:hypothetical protein
VPGIKYVRLDNSADVWQRACTLPNGADRCGLVRRNAEQSNKSGSAFVSVSNCGCACMYPPHPTPGAKPDNKVIGVSFFNHHLNALDNNIFV